MDTIISGVIGHPIEHSLSPIIHNAAYKQLGLNWKYEKFDLAPENARQGIKDIFEKGCGGLNVTMPHKDLAYEMSTAHGAASRLRTVNTLISDEENKLHGYSTDGQGFIESLKSENVDVEQKQVLVLGAGGASRAICDSLFRSNAKVFLAARNLEQAMNAIESIISSNTSDGKKMDGAIDIIDFSQRNDFVGECDLIVNATPIGMKVSSETDSTTPLDVSAISSDQIVIDTIYHPLETEFLRQSKEKGCQVFNGLGMLVHQGALAFTLMTRQPAPIQVMKDALIAHLESQAKM